MYLAKVFKRDPNKPKKPSNKKTLTEESEEPLENVKLVDGERGVDQ